MILSSPIASGFTAQIFAWKPGWVLKLFNQGIARETVEMEARLARSVHATGLPVPAVGQVVAVDGRFGLEYERVDGITMLQAFRNQPWSFFAHAQQLAELHAATHAICISDLPSQKDRLASKIRRAALLPEDVRQAALQALTRLPVQDYLCHGDFHPNNILLSQRGPVIIDWLDASRGCPIMDVARSSLLFGGGPLPPGIPWSVRILRGWFYHIYLRHYRQLNPFDLRQLQKWIPVAAAARLSENIHVDEQRLLSIAKKLVRQAIPNVGTA